jgi:hypothetical protein
LNPKILGSSLRQLKKLRKKSFSFFENDPFPLPKFLRIDPEHCKIIPETWITELHKSQNGVLA